MADGRQFENGFIAISQPEIMRLNEIWCPGPLRANSGYAPEVIVSK